MYRNANPITLHPPTHPPPQKKLIYHVRPFKRYRVYPIALIAPRGLVMRQDADVIISCKDLIFILA